MRFMAGLESDFLDVSCSTPVIGIYDVTSKFGSVKAMLSYARIARFVVKKMEMFATAPALAGEKRRVEFVK